eukprot:COSAG05_NODE_1349_length_5113_cov_6.734144_3_plen_119_part_00
MDTRMKTDKITVVKQASGLARNHLVRCMSRYNGGAEAAATQQALHLALLGSASRTSHRDPHSYFECTQDHTKQALLSVLVSKPRARGRTQHTVEMQTVSVGLADQQISRGQPEHVFGM